MGERSNVPTDELVTEKEISMNGFVNGNGSMMWGMGLGGIVVTVLVVLAIAALVKYVFLTK